MTEPLIGVAITTRNRREQLFDSLQHWVEHYPPGGAGVVFVIVDDASDEPVHLGGWRGIPMHLKRRFRVVRNPYRMGVAMSKNRGIEFLMQHPVQHLFLADDDIYPTSPEWWRPYVESPEPHLSYQWASKAPWKQVHRDDQHWSIRFPRGVMLYAERRVIERVGGMDPAHGVWGGEHVEWSQRIHDAGLTSWPYADVVNSSGLWYSVDQRRGNAANSTVPLVERRVLAHRNGIQWGKNGDGFVPYAPGQRHTPIVKGPHVIPPRGHETDHYWLLQHVLDLKPHGVALEFGVGGATSTRKILNRMKLTGFDSSQGLPEDWRPEFPKGSFTYDPPWELLGTNDFSMSIGLFEDTLPNWVAYMSGTPVGLVHIDCDLYSSTKTVFDHIWHLLVPGTYVVFDEFWDYPGHDQHEMKAWKELVMTKPISWTVVGHHNESWAIRIV